MSELDINDIDAFLLKICPENEKNISKKMALNQVKQSLVRLKSLLPKTSVKVESVAEPVTEPVVEHVAEPVTETVEHVADPVTETVAEPATEPVTEHVEPVTGPVSEPVKPPQLVRPVRVAQKRYLL